MYRGIHGELLTLYLDHLFDSYQETRGSYDVDKKMHRFSRVTLRSKVKFIFNRFFNWTRCKQHLRFLGDVLAKRKQATGD